MGGSKKVRGFKSADEVYCPCSSEWLSKEELEDHLEEIGMSCEGTHKQYAVINKQSKNSMTVTPMNSQSSKK